MMNLLQIKGKKHYLKCDTKRDFDDLIDACIAQGITTFGSGKPLDKNEYYNHNKCACKIKEDGTLAFVNYNPATSKATVSNYVCQEKSGKAKWGDTICGSEVKKSSLKKEKKDMKLDGMLKGMGFEVVNTKEFGLDIMSGKIAYLNKDKATIIDGKRDLTETLPDMVKTVPLMFIPTPINQLKVDDIIKRNNKVGVITKIDGNQIQIQNYSGTVSSETIAKHVITQTAFVSKLFNPFSGLGGENGAINPAMMLLFGDDSDDDNLSTFIMMQAMNNGGASGAINPLAMIMLLKDNTDGEDDMLTNIMLMQSISGQTGVANPLQSMLPLIMCGDKIDFKTMLLMQSMSGNSGAMDMNSLLPLLFMSKGGGGDMKSLAMMSMFSGGGNMFGNMFGAQPTQKTENPSTTD